MDDQQRAREQFEAWANAEGYCVSRLTGHNYLDVAVHAAWEAWQAALRAAPEGFVIVPRIPTPQMDAHGRAALSDNGVDSVDDSDALICWAAMLAARPQRVKDA